MAHNTSTPPVVADALALALVASSDAPIVLLDGDLDVVAASASFSRAFQIEPGAASRLASRPHGELGRLWRLRPSPRNLPHSAALGPEENIL